MAMPGVLSYKDIIVEVNKFLQIIFHSILYLRRVYPAQIFTQKEAYGISVWQSRNPPLHEYVKRVVDCVTEELQKRTLQKVALVIKATGLDETPLERFVFDFEWLCDDSAFSTGEDFLPATRGVTKADLADLFRSLISKITYAATLYAELDREVSFAIVAEMHESDCPPESELARKKLVENEWFPAEERAPGGLQTSRLNPLRSVSMGLLTMQVMVEELEGRREPSSAPSHAPTSSGESDFKGKGRAY